LPLWLSDAEHKAVQLSKNCAGSMKRILGKTVPLLSKT